MKSKNNSYFRARLAPPLRNPDRSASVMHGSIQAEMKLLEGMLA